MTVNLRVFVVEAMERAQATTDDDIRMVAGRADANGIAAAHYGKGMRDGVIETCQQVLAKLDEIEAG